MDVPAPQDGVVNAITVKVGDKVSDGSVEMKYNGEGGAAVEGAKRARGSNAIDEKAFALAYAGPAVRKVARELGVDLGRVKGTGAHGRIVREDVEAFAKGGGAASAPAAAPAKASGSGGG